MLDALCYCVVVLLPVCYFIGLLHTIHCRAVCYNVVFFKQCFFLCCCMQCVILLETFCYYVVVFNTVYFFVFVLNAVCYVDVL